MLKGASARTRLPLVALSFAVALPVLAEGPAPPSQSRGALLYQTHCTACHDTQVHWRERRLVKDWPSLAAQVRRWQANAGLQWSEEEIDDVARYLNSTIYRFPDESSRQMGLAGPGSRAGAYFSERRLLIDAPHTRNFSQE